MDTKKLIGLPARLFVNAISIITLVAILVFIVNSFTSSNRVVYFNSYVTALNSFVSTSLASQQAGQLLFKDEEMLVQIYGGANFEPAPIYFNVCIDEDTCYGGAREDKSCLAVLDNLYSKKITKVNYADKCKDKYCLCFVKLLRSQAPELFGAGGSYEKLPQIPDWWAMTEGASLYAVRTAHSEAGTIEYTNYPFEAYHGMWSLLKTSAVEETQENVIANFAYADFADNIKNNPENYQKIQNIAVNNCFEFFGVNKKDAYPEEVFEEVACRPIEGTDTEGRQLFLSGALDIENTDAILLWIKVPEKFSISATRFMREYDLPEIGAEMIMGG